MANLSDKLGSLTFTPKSQSPYKAGAIVQVASNDVTAWEQAGWFKCDGSEYAEADYAQLFAVLGSKYNTGGETASHFRVPNGPRRTEDTTLSFNTTPTGWSLVGATGYCYQDALGGWRLNFNVVANVTGSTDISVNIDGITFKNITNYFQALAPMGQTSATVRAFTNPNTSTIQMQGSSTNVFYISGDVSLDSKPTDAFVGADSRFSTFDEALESIPMIKVYDDASNIAISLADATATKTGAVRLSSDFAATSSQYGLVFGKKSVTNQDQSGLANLTVTDVGVETLVLPAGTYLLSFGASFRIQSTGISTGAAAIGTLYVTDDSNTILTDNTSDYHNSITCSRGADGTTDQYQGVFAKVETIILGSETTVKIRAQISDLASSASAREVLNSYMVWERTS